MIGKLRGIVDELGEDFVILDVGGVGYTCFASAKTLSMLPQAGGQAALITETHVREDHIHLYGFANRDERDWFRTLTTVQGVGVKMALAILSMFAPHDLARIIAAQDKKSLTAASGVGPKLAERMVTELKNKVHTMAGAAGFAMPAHAGTAATKDAGKKAGGKIAATESAPDILGDAVSALAHLGYSRADAFAAVSRYAQSHENAALDDVIRNCLRELAA